MINLALVGGVLVEVDKHVAGVRKPRHGLAERVSGLTQRLRRPELVP